MENFDIESSVHAERQGSMAGRALSRVHCNEDQKDRLQNTIRMTNQIQNEAQIQTQHEFKEQVDGGLTRANMKTLDDWCANLWDCWVRVHTEEIETHFVDENTRLNIEIGMMQGEAFVVASSKACKLCP